MKIVRRIGIGLLSFFSVLIIGLIVYYQIAVQIEPPVVENKEVLKLERSVAENNFYTLGQNWFRKNEYGLWEMYLEGNAFDRGVIRGKLSKELIDAQEAEFVGQIKKLIPSESYLKFLKYMVAWFNRDIDTYIPLEYQKEIYGVSLMATDEYKYIGDNYIRILNYHAAHDIGHALQDKNFVPGCTSFSTWNGRSQDGSLLIGRNFDFYVGEKFSEDKIICFLAPDSGYKMMYVTWGAMTGVVSGMNEMGLTVTINASKSDFPTGSATPISILAREILQYASTIEEAYKIAQKRKTFVSESILIGSAKDKKAAIVEKSPSRIDLYEETDEDLICSNHYQGSIFASDTGIKERSSVYRYERTKELLGEKKAFTPNDFASVLRNRKGLGDKNIGMGNEKALNQLIAHHAIIFQPEQKRVWVSSNPYQLGAFVCYDLTKIFNLHKGKKDNSEIHESSLLIPADTFLLSQEYKQFEQYKQLKFELLDAIKNTRSVEESKLDLFQQSNPEFYYTWWILGDYYYDVKKDFSQAKKYYKIALTKEVPRDNEIAYLQKAIGECVKKQTPKP